MFVNFVRLLSSSALRQLIKSPDSRPLLPSRCMLILFQLIFLKSRVSEKIMLTFHACGASWINTSDSRVDEKTVNRSRNLVVLERGNYY